MQRIADMKAALLALGVALASGCGGSHHSDPATPAVTNDNATGAGVSNAGTTSNGSPGAATSNSTSGVGETGTVPLLDAGTGDAAPR